MGQKTNPIGFRLIVNKDWRSKWHADKKDFGALLVEDHKIRQLLKSKLQAAAVPRIQIERGSPSTPPGRVWSSGARVPRSTASRRNSAR